MDPAEPENEFKKISTKSIFKIVSVLKMFRGKPRKVLKWACNP